MPAPRKRRIPPATSQAGNRIELFQHSSGLFVITGGRTGLAPGPVGGREAIRRWEMQSMGSTSGLGKLLWPVALLTFCLALAVRADDQDKGTGKRKEKSAPKATDR